MVQAAGLWDVEMVESVQLDVCCWEWGWGQEEVKNDFYRDSDLSEL